MIKEGIYNGSSDDFLEDWYRKYNNNYNNVIIYVLPVLFIYAPNPTYRFWIFVQAHCMKVSTFFSLGLQIIYV